MAEDTVTIPQCDKKLRQQEELEARMLEDTRARNRRRTDKAKHNGTYPETPVGKALAARIQVPVEKKITEWIAAANSGKPGRRSTAVKMVSGMDPSVLAVVTIKYGITACIEHTRWSRATQTLGKLIEDEAMMAFFYAQNPVASGWSEKEIKRRGIHHRDRARYHYIRTLKYNKVEWPKWNSRSILLLGETLLSFFADTGFMRRETVFQRGKKIERVVPTDLVSEWIAKGEVKGELLRPLTLPMIVKPKPRSDFYGSGYMLDIRDGRSFIKGARQKHKAARESADMTRVYSACQSLDNTARKINTRVLETLKLVWAAGEACAGLPKRTDIPLPPKLSDSKWKRMSKQDRKTHRRKIRTTHEENRSSLSSRLFVERVIEIADRFKGEPELYFPHDLDFRGRVYDVPTSFNPQGPDFARSLLSFSEGKPVVHREAMGWLMIHGANVFGYDKVDFQDRIEWVQKHKKQIEAVDRDPLANRWWTEADKPFAFLAWCFDYCGVLKGKPSYIAVAMDGSCNGLQHLSAMLRDPVGGKAVNLVPGKVPADIYTEVANVVIAHLKKEKNDDLKWIAKAWLKFGIDRKLTKRSTMVMPYGGKLLSTMDYVKQAFAEKVAGGKQNPFGDEDDKACVYLGKLIHKSIREVVRKAAEAMTWLQQVASVCSKANIPMAWTTPSGFVVVQEYMEVKSQRVDTYLYGSGRRYVMWFEETAKVDRNRMKNGISPNFVHALDAAALVLTVNDAVNQGVTHFEMIHDSYGTHAADTAILASCLREQFVRMYEENDVLEQFRVEILAQLPEDLRDQVPPLPKRGNLNIQRVLKSHFFFA